MGFENRTKITHVFKTIFRSITCFVEFLGNMCFLFFVILECSFEIDTVVTVDFFDFFPGIFV